MTVINTNTAALHAQYNLSKVQNSMDSAMERLSSGKRINTAADDAAGIAISTRMEAEINGIQQAIRNASDGQALIDTAEGAHDEITNMLQRMRELAVQSANDSNSDDDRAALQLEIDQLLTEVDRISESTAWAGKTLMGGEAGGASTFTFQIGATASAADQISVTIDDTSSDALEIGATSVSGGRDTGPVGVSYDNGTLSIIGEPEQGDAFSFTINGRSISTTYAITDEYADNVAGAAAQIKAAIDADIASSPTTYVGMSVLDNGDGTLSISQSTSVTLDTFAPGGSETGTFDVANGRLTIGGTAANTDSFSFNINGVAVSVTRTASDGYGTSVAGHAAAIKAQVDLTAGLENVNVVDHGDGSLTFTQDSSPFIEGLTATLTTSEDLSLSYGNNGTITVSGAFAANQTVSFNLLGHDISFTTESGGQYEDTLAGVAAQLSAAINDAGIAGLTAAKDSGANTVTMTADVVSGNAVVDSGADFMVTTLGDAATSSIAITGAVDDTIGSLTTAAYANGDSYTFEVLGHELKLVIAADGYGNDDEGVSAQLADMINALNLEGVTATANAGANNAQVDITRAITGTANGGSTVMTNIQSLSADEVGDPTYTGAIDVSTSDAAANAIGRIDAALQKINEQRAELGAVSNRLEHTITNLSNVNTNIQASQSRIQDADFATETSALTKSQILSQAATAMLAQANASKQSVLSLLQG